MVWVEEWRGIEDRSRLVTKDNDEARDGALSGMPDSFCCHFATSAAGKTHRGCECGVDACRVCTKVKVCFAKK